MKQKKTCELFSEFYYQSMKNCPFSIFYITIQNIIVIITLSWKSNITVIYTTKSLGYIDNQP